MRNQPTDPDPSVGQAGAYLPLGTRQVGWERGNMPFMRGRVLGGIALAVVAVTGCGPDSTGASPTPSFVAAEIPATASPTSTAVRTVTTPPTVTTWSTADTAMGGCAPIPRVQLSSAGATVTADLMHYGEQSPTCGYAADGDAMFNPAFRPEGSLLASDGRLEIAVDEPGVVTVDVRVLDPSIRIASLAAGGQMPPNSDGAYPVTLPGAGCFVVTVGFTTDTRSGQFAALASSSPDGCHPG